VPRTDSERIDSQLSPKTAKPGTKLKAAITLVNLLRAAVATRLLGHPNLRPGSTNTKFQVDAFEYVINGKTYKKAAADDVAAPGAGSNTGVGEYRKSLLSIDSAGTIAVTPGSVSKVSQATAALPDCPANQCPIGWLELAPSFVSGTTALTGLCVSGEREGSVGAAVDALS
jgi:hypothetical protein